MAVAPNVEQDLAELLQFIYLMPVAVARCGPTGNVELLNPAAIQLLENLDIKTSSADLPSILDALSPGLAGRWRTSASHFGAVMPAQHCSVTQSDRPTTHLLLQLVRPDERCTMLTINDITAMVEQERELERQRRRIGLMLEHIEGYCVAMLDSGGVVNEWNPSIDRLLGLAAKEIVGQPLLHFAIEPVGRLAPPTTFQDIQKQIGAHGWYGLKNSWHKANGGELWGDSVIAPVVDGDGSTSGYVAVIRDVTEEHWRTQKLIDAALTDPLTGLFNRRGLLERAEALQKRTVDPPMAFFWIMVDIDRFKGVNDTYGHDAGDKVLSSIAGALRATARASDVLARFGGEEFVVLLPDVTAELAGIIAERMRCAVAALATEVDGHTIAVTASFGIAGQRPAESRESVLERADKALYEAKNAGRDRLMSSAE